MPEGDNIFQIAARLNPALAGQRILRFFSPLPTLKDAELADATVKRVAAHGKNLVIELEDGRALHTHLGMHGRWLLRQKQRMTPEALERAARPPHSLNPVFTLSIETAGAIAICEQASIAELVSGRELERRLSAVGPDLLSADFDAARARSNLRSRPELTIGEALLQQSLLAGIGNIYKSEVLFLEKVSPFIPVGDLDDRTLDALIERARTLLRRNSKGPRRTTFGTLSRMPYYVYERSGQHCIKCDATIRMSRQGPALRSTYFCPECQRVKT